MSLTLEVSGPVVSSILSAACTGYEIGTGFEQVVVFPVGRVVFAILFIMYILVEHCCIYMASIL